MDFLKPVDYDREITGLHLSGYGNRRFLAVSEKRLDNHIYLLIYDMKSQNYKTMSPKYTVNISDLAYGHHGKRGEDHGGYKKDEE
jgi:hypothetical protein